MDFFTKTNSSTGLEKLSKEKENYPVNIKIPWVEKYRPKNSEEILLEPFIKEKIEKILLWTLKFSSNLLYELPFSANLYDLEV